MLLRKKILNIGNLRRLAVLLLFVVAPFFAAKAAVDNTIPHELSDLDKIRLMMAIQAEYPPFLKNGVGYGFDPFEVLDDQIRLMEQLARLPQYLHAMQTRPDLLDITIQDRHARAVKNISVDPRQLSEWRQGLLATYQEYPEYNREIVSTINQLNKRNPEAMLNAEIVKLGADLKKEAFRQGSFSAKLAFLKNSSAVPGEIKKSLSEIEEAAALQLKLEKLTELSILLLKEDGQPMAQAQALQRLSDLGEADLNHFLDYNDYVKPRLDALNQILENLQHHTAVRTSVAGSISARAKARMSVTVETIEQEVKNEIHLVELRPLAGVFRACSGGDCSTKYSFAAPNNPDELVFNIVGADGKSKGYLEATRVLAGGKPALYVSCINGAKISKNDVEMILQALHDQRYTLHFVDLLLPKAGNLGSLVNYENIIEAMNQSTHQELIDITHTNREIRGAIETFRSRYMQMSYDSMRSNTQGRLYKSRAPGLAADLAVSIQSKAAKPIVIDQGTNVSKVINFVIENYATQNSTALTNRALKALSISEADWLAFHHLLKNELHLPTAEFLKQLAESYKKLVKDPAANVSDLDSWILATGHLNAPDALQAANAEASVDFLFSLQGKRSDLFESYCYSLVAGMFGEGESTPGARLIFEKLFKSKTPAIQEICRSILARYPKWPPEAFDALPNLLASMRMPNLPMLKNLQLQGDLAESVWKEILAVVKPESPGFASILLYQRDWPAEVWPDIPKLLLALNEPERQPNIYFLAAKKNWPASFWKEIPRLLEELPWGARLALIREFKAHGPIPKEFIDAVPSFADKLEFRVRDTLFKELNESPDGCEKLFLGLK